MNTSTDAITNNIISSYQTMIIIVILIIIVVNIIFGLITRSIAKNKLRSPLFFFLGFFLNWVGVIIVLLIEDYRNFLRPLNVHVIKNQLFLNNEKISIKEYGVLVNQYKNNPTVATPTTNNSQDRLDDIEKKLNKIDKMYANGKINLNEKNQLRKEVLNNEKNL